METLWQDLRYALRLVRQRPAYTAIAVITLALGIGATTTIFTIADAVLFRPLPFRDPDRLVELWNSMPERKMFFPRLSREAIREWRSQDHLFEGMEGYDTANVILIGGEEPESVQAVYMTPGLFSFLGVGPERGRNFTSSDAAADAERVTIISQALFEQRFGRDPEVIGKQLRVGDHSYTIIGVMPAAFRFPLEATRLWLPISVDAAPAAGEPRMLHTITRLRPDVSVAAAQEQVDQIAKRLEAEKPVAGGGWSVMLQTFENMRVQREHRLAILVLLGAVGFVLLIACLNTANLMLAQTTVRGREIAIRAALGADRFRLIRQMLTESAMLSILGGSLGLLGALWGVELLTRWLPRGFTFFNYNAIGVDLRVLAFSAAISLAVGLFFGLLPALRGSRLDLTEWLKSAGNTLSGARSQNRMRKTLIAVELALSLVLLAGAGLLANSFIRLLYIDPGFRTENLLAVDLTLARAKAPTGVEEEAFFSALVERVKAMPGVTGVTTAMGVPPQTGVQFGDLEAEGYTPTEADKNAILSFNTVAPDYFSVIGARILKGRAFTQADMTDAPRVVILNRTLAEHLYPNGDAVGRRWRLTGSRDEPWFEVVGVVDDIKDNGVQSKYSKYGAYYPFATGKGAYRSRTLIVRTEGDPMAIVPAVKTAVYSLDKNQPIGRINTVENLFYDSLAQQRFYLLLMGLFAAVAITLAAVGVYGVISYAISQRRREFGIRLALGARAGDIVRLVVRQGLGPIALGAAAGLGGIFALTRYLTAMLYEVSATDPLTIAIVVVALTVVALAACLFPARRATRVDPTEALRCE